MNKTIYIRDEDVEVWDRAKELAGDKLSPVIVDGLKKFIAAKEAELDFVRGFERITVKFNDADTHNIPRIKSFHGKWIIPPTKPEIQCSEERDKQWSFSLAMTAKGAVVIYWVEEEEDGTAQYFKVYPSLETAAADREVNWVARKAITLIGVPVEELDI